MKSLFAARPMSGFFPSRPFQEDVRADQAYATFLSELLSAFDEPSVFSDASTGPICRFIRVPWTGLVTITPSGVSARLTTKKLNYVGVHPPPRGAYVETSRDLSEPEWKSFCSLFDATEFHHLPVANENWALGGYRWTCELRNEHTYHIVHRLLPDWKSAFGKLCDFVEFLADGRWKRRRTQNIRKVPSGSPSPFVQPESYW